MKNIKQSRNAQINRMRTNKEREKSEMEISEKRFDFSLSIHRIFISHSFFRYHSFIAHRSDLFVCRFVWDLLTWVWFDVADIAKRCMILCR